MREKGEPMVPQEWVGKRVEVDLVRPGPTLRGGTYQGTLNAVTDLGIVASLSTDARSETEERERFYPWSAVLSVDLRVGREVSICTTGLDRKWSRPSRKGEGDGRAGKKEEEAEVRRKGRSSSKRSPRIGRLRQVWSRQACRSSI